jgi:hypothetical protein
MTLVLGLKSNDCIVLGADKEENNQYLKYPVGMIVWYSFSNGWTMRFSGAGSAHLIDEQGRQIVNMKPLALIIIVLMARLPAVQQTQTPSLAATLDWMTNTLKPSEGHNTVVHRPFRKPYPPDWIRDGLDPSHSETITKFSHMDCRVEFDVEVTDNDTGVFGRYFVEHDVDTFDLNDIDPHSVQIEDACEPFETPLGSTTGWNCKDEQGKFLIFRTTDAKAKIHEESSGSSGKSMYSYHHKDQQDPTKTQADVFDELCKKMPGNTAYCDQPEHKRDSKDLTQSQLGFSTPDYAQRFAKAFKHAVELCGGQPSKF